MTDFPQLEKYYETRPFATFLKEDGTAKTLYLSQSSFPTNIYLNVYEHHLSFITDINMYSKQYICARCDKLFSHEEDKYEKWFACYDFQAYQRDFREGIDHVEELDLEEGTSWNKMHVPVSFSVGCNLEGVETVHVSSKDSEELTAKLVGTLFEMADKKYRAAVERFEYILSK